MNILGIIAEYNPFHNGHLWHLSRSKKLSNCDACLAVMSGNFVQRGEPAIFDKWTRASLAVAAGVDLVLELPAVFAVRSADYFAAGSISLLNALGTVNYLAFGAETPDIGLLTKTAEIIDDKDILAVVKNYLEQGYQYGAAFSLALQASHIYDPLVASPNNILAVQYLRFLKQNNSRITPLVIQREASKYHDKTIVSPIASATAIREYIEQLHDTETALKAIPETIQQSFKNKLINGVGPVTLEDFSPIILSTLRKFSDKDWSSLPEVSEGLENRLKKAVYQATNTQQLLEYTKSKRYPTSRLKRILIHAMLATSKDTITLSDQTGPLYARVLALNDTGREVLKIIKSRSSIPIITKTTHFLTSKIRSNSNLSPLQKMLAVDTYATDIYSLAVPKHSLRIGCRDFTTSPQYLFTHI